MSSFEDAIVAEEADRAFECLRCFKDIVLAVSGGSDSLALLYLMAEWRKRHPSHSPRVHVATVDHQLREESAREAQIVAEYAAALDLPHAILKWEGAKPATGISNAARTARYALLEHHAKTVAGDDHAVAVVTAHHEDDQAETVFMRLARGGGVAALAAMQENRTLDAGAARPVQLVRPLLAVSKQRLIATLNARNVLWIDDPTNINAALERTRVREALAVSGLTASALATTARRMRDAADGLAFAEAAFEATLALSIKRGIYARFDRDAFASGPAILRQMIISRLIADFGGASRQPELSEIEALALRFSEDREWAATLGGVMISAGSRYVRVWREPGRISQSPIVLTPGEMIRWDGRFCVGFEGQTATDVNVAPLGRAAYRTLDLEWPSHGDIPAAAAHGLPAFFAGAQLLSVPLLGVAASNLEPFKALRFRCDPIHPCNTD